MIKSCRHFYDFGPFRLIEDEGVLLRDGEVVPLKPKAFNTLVQLVQNSPHLVSKEDLMRAVWPDSVVEENNLNQQISALRKALGEGPQDQRYIETISKRGYRFTADVTKVGKWRHRNRPRYRRPRLSKSKPPRSRSSPIDPNPDKRNRHGPASSAL